MSSTKEPTVKYSDLETVVRESLGLADDDAPEQEDLQEAFVAQPKSFDLNTEKLSQKTKTAHLALYEGYVQAFDAVSAHLDGVNREAANPKASRYRELKVDETYNMNSIYLHELYFANIASPRSELSMDSLVYMRLSRDWGTFDAWQRDFLACSMAARDGWAVCSFNTYLQGYVNSIVDENDLSVPVGCYPVIVMDVHEHSYFHDYLNNRKKYVYNMMSELNWDVIENRFRRAEGIAQALK